MIATLAKQGGRRYCQLGNATAWRAYTSTGSGGAVMPGVMRPRALLGDAMPATASLRARAYGSAGAPVIPSVRFRRTLSGLGTRAGDRQLHEGN